VLAGLEQIEYQPTCMYDVNHGGDPADEYSVGNGDGNEILMVQEEGFHGDLSVQDDESQDHRYPDDQGSNDESERFEFHVVILPFY
jgi:hypothetical protein